MKRIAILFACILALFALSTCENQQVIGILKAPSELAYLHVEAFAADFPLVGGASIQPSFRTSVFNYIVYIHNDADRFSIDAGINGDGTIVAMSEADMVTGTEFDYFGDEPKVIIIKVQRKHMEEAEYRLTVQRADLVPVAEDIKISVEPPIGAFFISGGTIPKIKIDAKLPAAGGSLSYQWYMNTANISVGGYPISGVYGDTYTMQRGETLAVRTIYYYAEITNTIDGKTGVTVSPPISVTFVNKNDLDYKSLEMVDIPAGRIRGTDSDVITDNWLRFYFDYTDEWSTLGYKMGQCLVTWELWKTVFDYADAGVYRFARSGNQGGAIFRGTTGTTNGTPQDIGNRLNPVTVIGWRDAVVWCNAYSEMDGKQPVYVDKNGNALRNSRDAIEQLMDESQMEGKNGYRLPTAEEWTYAARGANPRAGPPWTDRLPGTNRDDLKGEYLWAASPELAANGAMKQTTVVGSLLPNSIDLYDMMGMVYQWVWWSTYGVEAIDRTYTWAFGSCISEPGYSLGHYTEVMFGDAYELVVNSTMFVGFRIVQGGL